jgi:hypothetical protein
MEVRGLNGQLKIEAGWLLIERKGAVARISKGRGDKRLRIDQITGVILRPATRLGNGYIHFATPGSDPQMDRAKATRDQNSVMFRRKDQAAFEAFRDELQQHG